MGMKGMKRRIATGVFAMLAATAGASLVSPPVAQCADAITLIRTISLDEVAGRSSLTNVVERKGEGKRLFALSADRDGDVALICAGIPVDVSYNTLTPTEESKEQRRRIASQQDPVMNGWSVKVTIPF